MNDFLAGTMSGFSQMFVGYPFDTLKVRLQNNTSNKKLALKHYYRGMMYPLITFGGLNSIVFGVHAKTQTICNNHFISGGLAGIACSPFVFLTDVGKIRRQMARRVQLSDFYKTRGIYSTLFREIIGLSTYFGAYHFCRDDGLNIPLSGAISGLTNWTVSYPLDVIRNRQMAQNIYFYNAYKQGALWKGYRICAIRALLVNSVGFWVYEKCKANAQLS
jgi:solute carrier family 25 carnitine/acylcarnitine transporter 20/29